MFRPSLLLLLAITPAASAQQPPTTGTITGHVFCADNHLPARLASVYLIPAVGSPGSSLRTNRDYERSHEVSTNVSQTVLDGSFTIRNVQPGNYYVVAEQPGYLSPVNQLSREAMEHPDKATIALMAQLLTPVTVAPNKLSTAEVSVMRGASISGTVHFDDGSPGVNARISILRQNAAGKWVSLHSPTLPAIASPDDRGNFRIFGLPAGTYLLQASLDLQDVITNGIFSEGSGSAAFPRYSLTLFSGGTARPKDAKPFNLSSGEELTLPDFEIPLAKLHTVTGTLLVGESGVPANAGRVALLYPDDQTELTSTTVSKDDSAFHFLYVPEGSYLLRVTAARQVSRSEVSTCDGCMPPTHTEERVLRTFGDIQQALVIENDITGLTVTVPPTPTPPKSSNSSTSSASN